MESDFLGAQLHCTIRDRTDGRWIPMHDATGISVPDGLTDLAEADVSAHRRISALVRRAAEGRFRIRDLEDSDDISAPVGDRLKQREFPSGIPWLAELRVRGTAPISGTRRQYRIYFGDVSHAHSQVKHRMVASQFDSKISGRPGAKKQTDAMRRAAKALEHWCTTNSESPRRLAD
ncbi:hypothetical protein QVA66_10390 [Staphylococcus chromogenes]|nr:hypothetical protein [Staphylococcus chromogenes]